MLLLLLTDLLFCGRRPLATEQRFAHIVISRYIEKYQVEAVVILIMTTLHVDELC